MTLSENQVRHFYVLDGTDNTSELKPLDDVKATLKDEGDFALAQTPEHRALYLQHKGKGGITRTDLLTKKNIIYVRYTKAAEMQQKLRSAVITLNDIADADDAAEGIQVAKGTYIVRVMVHNFVGMSDEDTYVKYGQVSSNGNLTASKFYAELALSLAKNFSRDIEPLFTVSLQTADGETPVEATTKLNKLTDDYTGVVITEAEQAWVLGTRARTRVLFDVALVPAEVDCGCTCCCGVAIGHNIVEYDWGTVEMKDSEKILTNGKDIADMEYFLMGERADVYRNVGWPHVITTQYMVDPSAEYDVLDIHYAFIGQNESCQKSEKTLTLVSSTGKLDKIVEALLGEGIEVIKKDGSQVVLAESEDANP